MRAVSCVLVGALGLLAVAGCGGPGGVRVAGKVVKDGAPVAPGDGETLTVKLSDGKDTYTSNAGADGTFTALKPSGDPIPAGRYKVSWVYMRSADPYTKKKAFKYGKENAEEWDVSPSAADFTLDIGRK
jgi:hypothetical protein